jgi:hypothetical protein
MIGSCDCCDRQQVPVSHFNATAAYPEGAACFICQGDTDPDPYGELGCCQKCGCETGGEEAWCHPCADEQESLSVTSQERNHPPSNAGE